MRIWAVQHFVSQRWLLSKLLRPHPQAFSGPPAFHSLVLTHSPLSIEGLFPLAQDARSSCASGSWEGRSSHLSLSQPWRARSRNSFSPAPDSPMAFTMHCLIPVFGERMHRAYAIVLALTLEYCAPLLWLNTLANPSPSYRPAPGSMPSPLGGTRPFTHMTH